MSPTAADSARSGSASVPDSSTGAGGAGSLCCGAASPGAGWLCEEGLRPKALDMEAKDSADGGPEGGCSPEGAKEPDGSKEFDASKEPVGAGGSKEFGGANAEEPGWGW